MGYNEDRRGTVSARHREPDRRPRHRRAQSPAESREPSPFFEKKSHAQRDAKRNGRDENRDWSPSHQQQNNDKASSENDWPAGSDGFVSAPISRRLYFIDRDQPRASFGDFVRRGVVSPVPELRYLMHDGPKWHPPERSPRQEDGCSPEGRRCRERAVPRQASFYETKHDAPRYNRGSRRHGGRKQQRQHQRYTLRHTSPTFNGNNKGVAWSDEDPPYNEQKQDERWQRQHSPARFDSPSVNHNQQAQNNNAPRYRDEIEPYRSPPRAFAPANSQQQRDRNENPVTWNDEVDHPYNEHRRAGNSSCQQRTGPRAAPPLFNRHSQEPVWNGKNATWRKDKRRGHPASQPRPAPIKPEHGGYGLDQTAHANWAAFEAKTAQGSSHSHQHRRPVESASSPRASASNVSQRRNDERRESAGGSPRAPAAVREVSPRDSVGDSQNSADSSDRGDSNRGNQKNEPSIAPHFLEFEEGQRLSIEALLQARKDLRENRRDPYEPHEECWQKYMTMRRAVHFDAEQKHKNRHAYFEDGTEFERIFGRPQEVDDWWDRQRASVAAWVVHPDNEGIRPGGWDLRADNEEPYGPNRQWDFPEWVQEEGTPPMKRMDLAEPFRPPSPPARKKF